MSLIETLKLPPRPVRRAPPPAAPADAPDRRRAALQLAQAASDWRGVHRLADARVEALKTAIQAHYAGAHPALLDEIENGMARIDAVLDNVDHRLADVLADAARAKDDAAHQAAVKSAKALLAQYVAYVKGEPLIAHMDSNPFGVKTGLRPLLAAGLADAIKAIR